TKHPAHVMVLGVVASDGKTMPPYYFRAGEKIECHVYVKVLKYHVSSWLKANYPSGHYVWTQDRAPSHTSKLAQDFCSRNFADFWPANYWPPTSPDLNPLDFAVWGFLQRESNSTPHPNVDSLKASITAAWANISTNFIKKSCAAFRHRIDDSLKLKEATLNKEDCQDFSF
ncbi:Uncharacterized protein FKW44_017363, partial [Caligus rogercresseyi]